MLDCLFGSHDMDEGEGLLRETSSEEQGFVTSALGYVKGIRTGSFVFFFKKCKHRSVIELCITLVSCNQVYI